MYGHQIVETILVSNIFQSKSKYIYLISLHGKKFGADAAPSGGAVAFSGGEL